MIKTTKILAALLASTCTCSMFLWSCQKELNGPLSSFGCKIQQWNELDSSGNLSVSYSYQYDTITGKPVLLQYNDIAAGNSRIILPVFRGDTVYFDLGSYAVLDASKRIVQLEEQNSTNAAVADGSYTYTYDPNGHLKTRIFDDGTGAQTTNYTFTGSDLTRIDQAVLGTPNALSTNISYSASGTATDFNQFLFSAAFPELLPFFPCFTIGSLPTRTISKTEIFINVGIPVPAINTTYSNYQFDTKGYVKKILLKTNVAGTTDTLKSGLEGNYLCR